MFQFIDKIQLNSYGHFFAAWGKLAYINTSQELILDNIKLASNGGSLDFFDFGKRIVYFDKEDEQYYYKNLEFNEPLKSLDGCIPMAKTFSENDVILSSLEISGSNIITHFFLANSENFELIKQLEKLSDYRVIARFNDSLIVTNKLGTELLGYHIEKDEFTWKIDQVKKRVIKKMDDKLMVNHRLYVKINRQLIAEIDIITGEVTRTWSNIYFENPEYVLQTGERKTIIPFFTHDCLLRENTRIGSLYDRGYREINLETGEVTHDYLLDYFREEQVTPFTNTTVYTHNDLIFFSSQHPNEEENRMEYSFGAFDSHTRKIVARYTFPPGKVGRGIKGPVANDKQVFILDYNNHLHIFDILA